MNREELNDRNDAILRGLEEAYRRMIIFKRQKNSPVIVSINGEVKEVDPHDMPDTTTYHR